ncbi:unnamed protein product [Gulo gulo]|uniref:Transmembrane protein 138 n=1 Tax=Gulo gulo TaxID=48420 RepID=A0A9X9LNI4_GULGU|nr:unnamed protein product [Gulo gulo]
MFFIIQDTAILFNISIIFLLFSNTFVFQAVLGNSVFHKFKGTALLTAVFFAPSIFLHVWVMTLRWKNSSINLSGERDFKLCIPETSMAVLYGYFCKWTAVRLGDPPFYQDSLCLHKFTNAKGNQFLLHWWMLFLPRRGYIFASVGWGLALCTGNSLTYLGQASGHLC